MPAVVLRNAVLVVAALLLGVAPTARDQKVPRYAHIFVIMEENKDYGQVIGSPDAPTITALAKTYGNATHFYAETHPSEPNYVALVGGYTYGIRDDNAYYCKPHDTRAGCSGSNDPGYVNHTIDAPTIGSQLEAAGYTWKNYNESIPKAGSLAVVAVDPKAKPGQRRLYLYASKHSGFINYASVQHDPNRAQHIVGFDQLYRDLASGDVPNLSLIVPNVCDEMHGSGQDEAPTDCRYAATGKLIWRGDQNVKKIVAAIMASPVWSGKANAAIVVTFDESGDGRFIGCCGNDPADPANRGGGHIPTVVVTNHGPRGVSDATPYSHYSLLRTIEDAFGITRYLKRANAPGVVPMVKLFAVRP